MSQCGLRTHPDANDDTTIEWEDSKIRKAILAAGGKGGKEMRMRWDCSEQKASTVGKTGSGRNFENRPSTGRMTG